MVGAVLVRDRKIIAEGFHAEFGKSHAERVLFEQYQGDIVPTDVLYVNLEPCCHHGKTPPCTDVILERGVKNIVYGMRDPDPRISGKGIQILINNGVHVFGPILGPKCERMNRGFVSMRTNNRPYVTLKFARTRDGRIAADDGKSLTITSEEQNRWAHTFLRSTHDAILVGVGTILTDDPLLDARFASQDIRHDPMRIILDPHLRVPLTARVVSDDRCDKTMIIHAPVVAREQEDVILELAKRGVLLREVAVIENTFDWPLLWNALTEPVGDYHGLTSILVEGGKHTWEAFRSAGMVDEEVLLIH